MILKLRPTKPAQKRQSPPSTPAIDTPWYTAMLEDIWKVK
jgi:hypothetical protein